MIRSKELTDAARGESCLLCVPGVCRGNSETVVACHSDWQEDGKGTGIKADDIYIAFGCVDCHSWLHSSGPSRDDKRDVFHRGMKRTWKRLIEKRVIQIKGVRL